MARRRAPGLVGAAAVALALPVAGCGSALLSGGAEHDAWLRDMGFQDRASWSSAVLHRDRAHLPGTARISIILNQVPGLTVTRPWSDGWGLERVRADGTRCELGLAVNGRPVNRGRMQTSWGVDNLARTPDVLGLEVHFGAEGPLVDAEGCGWVLLWTRREALDLDGDFRGGVVGTFRGEGRETVTEVTLEPGGVQAGFDDKGAFTARDVLPGAYDVVLRAGTAEVAREGVRVYAYADTRTDIVVGDPRRAPGLPREPDPPAPTLRPVGSPWLGCYAFRSLAWSEPLPDWAVPLHTPPDTFRLHPELGAGRLTFEDGRPLARPVLARPDWGGWPGAHWRDHGSDSATVVWTNGFTGATLALFPVGRGFAGRVAWVSDAVDPTNPPPVGSAGLERVACPPSLPDDPDGAGARFRGPGG